MESEGDDDPTTPLESLGKDLESWGWDLGDRTLTHAGVLLGRFPPVIKGATLSICKDGDSSRKCVLLL